MKHISRYTGDSITHIPNKSTNAPTFTKMVTSLFATHALQYDADTSVTNDPQLSQLFSCVTNFLESGGCYHGFFMEEFGWEDDASQIFGTFMPDIFNLIFEYQIRSTQIMNATVDLPSFLVENWDDSADLLSSPQNQQLVVWFAVSLVANKIIDAYEQDSSEQLIKYMQTAAMTH